MKETGKPLILDANYADPRMLCMASPFRFQKLEDRKTKDPECADFFASAYKQAKYNPNKFRHTEKMKSAPNSAADVDLPTPTLGLKNLSSPF